MKIVPINIFHKNNSSAPGKQTKKTNFSFNSNNKNKISFNGAMNKLAYEASLDYHYANILNTDPYRIEQFFNKNGITAFFREGTEFGKRAVAYCCYHAANIFDQLHYPKPRAVGIADFRRISGSEDATGLSFYGSGQISPYERYYPLTAIFNTFSANKPIVLNNGKQVKLNWENFIDIMNHSRKTNFLSTRHFMSPFIHEFAHNLHYHKIFSKFGAPEPVAGYVYNPNVLNDVFYKMNENLYEKKKGTNYIANFMIDEIPKEIDKEISYYGSTSLPETFAEAFTKQVVQYLDPYSLRLTKNPFPMNGDNKLINNVLHETYEGLVGDGKGIL